mmetsp:Transcript_6910/g.25775  ORF Transcript_6910/g.25775 Transcript_6910/m.25775 type:complete len:122 (+) Transcript_6910:2037-2402(+)
MVIGVFWIGSTSITERRRSLLMATSCESMWQKKGCLFWTKRFFVGGFVGGCHDNGLTPFLCDVECLDKDGVLFIRGIDDAIGLWDNTCSSTANTNDRARQDTIKFRTPASIIPISYFGLLL